MNRYFVLMRTVLVLSSLAGTLAFQAISPGAVVFHNNHGHARSIPSTTATIIQQRWGYKAVIDEHNSASSRVAEELRQNWINRSVEYYSKVMREERRRNLGQVEDFDSPAYQDRFMTLAARHYFALKKIKDGKPRHAEVIYRRIIDNLLLEKGDDDTHDCDHAKLAVTTLLLALHLQRTGASAKQTRSVFLTFFRVVALADDDDDNKECACSAKVIGAFALFEMKQGNTLKSLQLARRAFELDPTVMQPLLNWKQFRDAANQAHRHQLQKAAAAAMSPPVTEGGDSARSLSP
ncbi:hypothetical protein ACA910_009932 [Epithemia clementina (nom. ined.)]